MNEAGRVAIAAAGVFIVTVVVVMELLPGVTVGGEKRHEEPTGNPEQLKDTRELKPL